MTAPEETPPALHTITPYMTVSDPDGQIAFLLSVFDAELIMENRRADGTLQHARVRIGDSILMMNEAGGSYPANISQLHVYVADPTTTYERALEAGAHSLMEPNLRPHGDWMAGFADPQGNVWWVASPGT